MTEYSTFEIFLAIFAGIIIGASIHAIITDECPTERLVLDCADELVEEFIADHPDVCDGLCEEIEKEIDSSRCIYVDRTLCG